MFIDIVTGFLEGGKTTLLRQMLLRDTGFEDGKVLLLVCEEGIEEWEEVEELEHVVIQTISEEQLLDGTFMEQWIERYSPSHILMEYNGMWDMERVLGLPLGKDVRIRKVFFVGDASMFGRQLQNMPAKLYPMIQNSNAIFMNRYEQMTEQEKKKLRKDIRIMAPSSKVLYYDLLKEGGVERITKQFQLEDTSTSTLAKNFLMTLLAAFVIFSIPTFFVSSVQEYLQSVTTSFLSIVMQAIPFIMLGAFVSSVMQVYVSTQWIENRMSSNRLGSYFVAAGAGAFFPICDCGMVPIVSGLLRKNVSFPQTMTFWIASSAVNPVVIISTLYAFPDQPSLVILRIVIGVCMGILIGMALQWLRVDVNKAVLHKGPTYSASVEMRQLDVSTKRGKRIAVWLGARTEFFRVISYVIFGAAISSITQSVLPVAMKGWMQDNLVLQTFLMLIAAIVMSTCSTSNAFIGRSFVGSISLLPILGYIVAGPVLDFKNMMMLSAVIRNKYLLLIAGMVITVLLVGLSVASIMGVVL